MLQKIIAQHPLGDLTNLPDVPVDAPPVVLTEKIVKDAFKKADTGAAPGPSGISGRVMRQIAEDDDCLTYLTGILQAYVNGSLQDPEGRAMATAGMAVVIPKHGPALSHQDIVRQAMEDNDDEPDIVASLVSALFDLPSANDPDTKIRTINIGEIMIKVAGIACLSLISKDAIARILAPVQLGIGVKGGVEVGIHRLQAYCDQEGADPNIVTLFLDIADAFMTADRAKMLTAVFKFEELSPIWRLAHWHLSTANPRYVRMNHRKMFILHQTVGGPQGDSLMSVLFAVVIGKLHELVLANTPCCPAGILDDTAIGAKIDVAEQIYLRYVHLAPSTIGCHVNPPKTIVLSCAKSPSPAVFAFTAKYGITLHQGATSYCGVILGAQGTEAQQSEWAVEQVCKHSQMFQLLAHPRMSSQFVHNFLRICAIPQLMLIVRALSPDITLAATKLMDLCVRNTFITATHTAGGI